MASLATVDDYSVRFGDPDDHAQVERLLDEASSLVRAEAELTISAVAGDVVVLPGDGRDALLLPEYPVTAVASVTVDAEAVDVEWTSWGRLVREYGRWPHADVTVTYSHGWSPVPEWIVGLVCSMVWEARRPTTLAGERSISTGNQSVTYVGGQAGVAIPPEQLERVRSLRGSALA